MKLYLVHVGYYETDIGMYELHTNMLIAAPDVAIAKLAIKNKEIFIKKKMHIDGIQEIFHVDGYDIVLEKRAGITDSNKTYGYDTVKAI